MMKTTRTAAAALALAGLTLALTACGSSTDGTYYVKDVNGTDNLGQLVVDGTKVTHHEYDCDGAYDGADVDSSGELSDDGSQVTWTVVGDDERNERTGTETVQTTEGSMTVGDTVYLRDDSDEGKALMDEYKAENCGG